jgi:hypothetical protein
LTEPVGVGVGLAEVVRVDVVCVDDAELDVTTAGGTVVQAGRVLIAVEVTVGAVRVTVVVSLAVTVWVCVTVCVWVTAACGRSGPAQAPVTEVIVRDVVTVGVVSTMTVSVVRVVSVVVWVAVVVSVVVGVVQVVSVWVTVCVVAGAVTVTVV